MTVATAACPTAVAVIVVVPERTAVARPVSESIVTSAGFEVAHLAATPVAMLPLASRTVALKLRVAATTTVAEVGVTLTMKVPTVTWIGTEPVMGTGVRVCVWLVPAVTEKRTKTEIDGLVAALRERIGNG